MILKKTQLEDVPSTFAVAHNGTMTESQASLADCIAAEVA